MLAALSEAGAEYLVVGAHALAAHGFPRATGDLDIWVRPSPENAEKVWEGLIEFGAPMHDLTREDLSAPDVVFQIGLPPSRIDLLTTITGVEFEQAWANRLDVSVSGQTVPTIGRAELIRNKRATGRPRDLLDMEQLES
jgi:hypothetical protein